MLPDVILQHQPKKSTQKTNAMKTPKIFSVFSLALIFAAAATAFAGNTDKKNDPVASSALIRYQVNIVMPSELTLCNLWLVKILDGNGREVAPAKAFTAGVSRYEFFERGPVEGTRTAVLVVYDYGDHFLCPIELYTDPASLFGKFLNGETYRFDLYPTQDPRE
jgi:hypothetical protein